MRQTTFFDDEHHNDLRAKRDAAIDQVETNADQEWTQAARRALVSLCNRLPFLTSEDVAQAIPEDVTTHEPRALGPIMMWGRKLGWIEATSQFRTSTGAKNHCRPQRIWKSRTFQPTRSRTREVK